MIIEMAVCYYLVFGICFISAIYLLFMNSKSMLQRLAFFLCFSVALWGFSMGCSTLSDKIEQATVWRRMGAIGFGAFYGFFKHYLILFSERKSNLKRKISVIWMYLPSLIFILVFSLSKELTESVYQLERGTFGWNNTAEQFIWGKIFLIYFIAYFIVGIWRIGRYRRTCTDRVEKEQANILGILHIIIVALAIFSEYLNSFAIGRGDYQILGVGVIIIPILYNTKIMNINLKSLFGNESEENIYLEQYRKRIMIYLCQALILGAVTYVVVQFVNYGQSIVEKKMFFPLELVGLSLINLVVTKCIKNGELRTILHSLILFFIIPIITMEFFQSVAVTVWAFPFILMIAALLYHDTTVLIIIAASMILTQCFLWISSPSQWVRISETDYFGRILMMLFGIGVASYINYIYICRLRQLSNKIKEQDLLFHISTKVMSIDASSMQEHLTTITEMIGKYAGAKRTHLIIYGTSGQREDLQYFVASDQYCDDQQNEGDNLQEKRMIEIQSEIAQSSWFERKFQDEGYAYIDQIGNLPLSARVEEQLLEQQGVESLFAIPIMRNGIQTGMLRMDFSTKEACNGKDRIQTFMTVGNLIGEAYGKAEDDGKMTHLAFFDQLTNIPNRQLFGEHIKQSIENAKRQNNSFCILFLDLDEFKTVNDSVGHQAGDQILIRVAQQLEASVRKSDVVCRFGGDEFLIMLNHIETKRDIETVLKKIMAVFAKPIQMGEHYFNLTASIGVSVYPFDGREENALIKNADIAMFKAKENGKNQVVFCTDEMKDEIAQVIVITNHLYRALEKKEFYLVYQPQIDSETEAVIAMEVLLRWKNEDLGIVMPTTFIPLIEQSGMINSIGEWVLEEACRQSKEWMQMGFAPIRIAVNISVIQLGDSGFIQKVTDILQRTKLEPKYLELEITENVALLESKMIIERLVALRNMGISLTIDDFGMEYSSLNRIKSFPVDRLKIDMNFVQGIMTNSKDRAIIEVIINLAKNLNLKVIAEGVEELCQVEVLKELSCDEMQGYYFYHPLEKEEMEKILSNL